MSLFGRILTRAALPGHLAPPLARPKGLVGGISRAPAPEPDEPEAAPLARAAAEPVAGDETARPPRRAAAAPGEDDKALPLHRATAPPAEDEPLAPLRRLAQAPGEEDAQALRRAAEPDSEEEEAKPLRRAPEPPADEEKAQPLRRAPPVSAHRYPVLPKLVLRAAPEAEALTAENSPRPAEVSAQPENEPAMALRRDAGRPQVAPAVAPTDAQPAGPIFDPPQAEIVSDAREQVGPAALWQAFEPERPARPQPEPQWPAFEPQVDRPQSAQPERPRVVIEQIDVSITEPASTGQGQADFTASLNRAIRSRYLGK